MSKYTITKKKKQPPGGLRGSKRSLHGLSWRPQERFRRVLEAFQRISFEFKGALRGIGALVTEGFGFYWHPGHSEGAMCDTRSF